MRGSIIVWLLVIKLHLVALESLVVQTLLHLYLIVGFLSD